MKKLFYAIIVLALLLVVPFSVFADEEPVEETNKKVPLYFFRGEGCSHCAEAEEWFESIQEEYGEYFEIKDYETWYNEDNADLMQRVADARKESADGVPYIIVGNKSWNGFTDSYKDEILSEIKEVYAQDVAERYDILQYVETGSKKESKKSSTGDFVALFFILVITGGIGFGIYKTRTSSK